MQTTSRGVVCQDVLFYKDLKIKSFLYKKSPQERAFFSFICKKYYFWLIGSPSRVNFSTFAFLRKSANVSATAF